MVVVCFLVAGIVETHAQSSALPSGWVSRDVGGPTPSGRTSVSGGTWTIVGGGDNVWGTADEFHFAYRVMSGDVDISARVASFDDANEWSKAGIMIRDGLAANARNAFALLSPGIGAALQQRTTTGGNTTRTESGSGAAPAWVRLVRQGSSFTAYRSADGRSWTTIATTTISMPATMYVGFAVTSRDPGQSATATFTNLQIGTALPTPWRNRDVGSPARTGTAASTGSGAFTVWGSGAAIWDNDDEFHYVYQPVQGNTEIVARVASLQVTNEGAKAGVMIRESLSAGARHASMFATGSLGWRFQYREVTNGISFNELGPGSNAPGWVRLVRASNLFTAYYSTNGSTWSLVGSDTIAMSSTVYVGLAVSSRVTTATAAATFTNVRVSTPTAAAGANTPPTVSLTSPSYGATYTAPASMTIAATANDSDGTVARVDLYLGSTLLKSDTTVPYSVALSDVAAGTYQLKAVARDNDGASTAVSITVTVNGTATRPTKVAFVPSANHATSVTSYVVALYRASDPVTASPVATRDLGKPAVLSGEITADISTLVNALPAGSYYAIVRAVGPGGTTPSTKSANFTK